MKRIFYPIALGIRLLLSTVLLVGVYRETGWVTTLTMTLLIISIELNTANR